MSIPWTAAGGWLLHSAVGGGLLLLLACGLMKGTRQPARRQRLGECGLAAALLLAVLGLGPTWLEVPWPVPEMASQAAAHYAGPSHPALAAELDGEWEAGAEVPAVLEPNGQGAEPPAPAAALGEGPRGAAALALAVVLLVGTFLAGAAFFLGRWLLGHVALARLLRRAGPVPEALDRLFRDMLPGRPPRLLVSRDLRVPISCGLLRPTIVLPAGLCEPAAADKLRWVLGHELTHLQRRDAWSGLLLGLGQAVYFYVPCFWWLRRQVRLCQEYVADAAAVERGVPPADYAEFLLSLVPASAVPAAATGVSGHGSDLYRRVTMLLQEPLRVEKHCPRGWSLGAAGGLLAVAVVVAGVGLRPTAAAAEDEPAQADKAKAAKVIRVEVVGQPDKAKPGGVINLVEQVVPAPDRIVVIEKVSPGEDKVIIHKRVEGGSNEVRSEKRASGEPGVVIKKSGMGPGEVKVIVNQKEITRPGSGASKKADAHMDAIRKALEKLEKVPGADVEQIRKEILKALEQVQKQAGASARQAAAKALADQADWLRRSQLGISRDKLKAEELQNLVRNRVRFGQLTPKGRLGIEVEKPAAALADQLNLPKGRGLVVVGVKAGSPADKAGVKANDILLELAGKAVTSEPGDLPKALEGLPADKAVDAVVLRKGKRETVKGLKVGADGRLRAQFLNEKADPNLKLELTVPDAKVQKRRQEIKDKLPAADAAGHTVTVTTFRTGERFTTRYQEGNLVITVVGQDNQPSEITVQDGTVTNKYAGVSEVPARYRDKVEHVIRSATSGSVRIERK
jgi:beta-lactamase regulating signal transducer with metallopeptidase domain